MENKTTESPAHFDIVLDSNILINFPQILSYQRKDTKLIVPETVLKELMNRGHDRLKAVVGLALRAFDQNLISVFDSPQQGTGDPEIASLGFFDDRLIASVLRMKQQNKDVIFATEDKKLAHILQKKNISTYDIDDLKRHFQKGQGNAEKTLNKDATDIDNKDRFSILINFLAAVALVAGFVWVIRRFPQIVNKFGDVAWIILLTLLGFALYEFREKRRQLYGLIEILFGILTITIIFYPDIIFSNWQLLLKIGAGLYIIVRGMDNLAKGSENRKLGLLIKRLLRIK